MGAVILQFNASLYYIFAALVVVNPLNLNLTMSTDPTFIHDHAAQSETPPIPSQMLSLAHRLLELDDEQQLRELLDSTLSQNCNIHHLSGAMVEAVRSNKVYVVKELLRRELPISPLYVFEAVKSKAKEVLTMFFENGWDINKPMSEMTPPNPYVSKPAPFQANALEGPEMTAWLLDKGADPNGRCDIDFTPLSYAVQVVEDLIERGVPLNSLMYEDHQASRNMFPFMKETPLHTAVALKKPDVIRYLIRKGADMNVQNYNGQTVIQCADDETRREIMQEVRNRSMPYASL